MSHVPAARSTSRPVVFGDLSQDSPAPDDAPAAPRVPAARRGTSAAFATLRRLLPLVSLFLCVAVVSGCAARNPDVTRIQALGENEGSVALNIVKPLKGEALPAAYVLGMTFPTSAFTRYGLDAAIVQELRESDRVVFTMGFELRDAQGDYVREFYPHMTCTVGEKTARCVAAGLFDGISADRVMEATTLRMAR